MAWVQGKAGADPGSGTSCSVTLTNPVGSGNTIVGFVVTASGVSTATATDDKGNSYTTVIEAGEFVLFYLTNITNGPSTITVSFGGGTISHPEAIADEYSGIASITGTSYQTVSGPGTGNDGISPGNVTTSEADVVWGAVANYGGFFPAAGTGFTQRSTSSPSGDGLVSEDKTQVSAGSVAATFTAPSGGGSSQYYCGMITMKPSGSSPVTISLNEAFADFTLSGTAGVIVAASLNEAFADFTLSGNANVFTPVVVATPAGIFQPRDLMHAMSWLTKAQQALNAAIVSGDPSQIPQLTAQVQYWTGMVNALRLSQSLGIKAEATRQGLTFCTPIQPATGEN